MIDNAELTALEAELRGLKPVSLSPAFRRRLAEVMPAKPAVAPAPASWFHLLRWLVPAGAVTIAAILATWFMWQGNEGLPVASAASPTLHADEVRIDRQLVSSCQTVAESPEGLPIRFELQEWLDQITFRDTRQGITVHKASSRVEVVPVKYESY